LTAIPLLISGMKTKRAQTFTLAFLASSLAFSGIAGAFDPAVPAHPRTWRESVSSAGTPAIGTVGPGTLSANGRFVVFMSSASNLAGVIGTHVYRHDRTNGATVLVDVAKAGGASSAGSFMPSVSADGRFVAFASPSADLVTGDTNGMMDVFLRDMNSGTTAMVSAAQTGAPADKGGSLANVAGSRLVSDDGRYVAFTSSATNLVATSNTKQQVYVKDMLSGVVTLASADATGAAGNDTSSAPSLAGNGHAVAFVSLAANFSPLSTSHTSQVFVRDLELGTTSLESVTSTGAIFAAKPATSPALSFDGHYVVFETQAQLDPRDRDGAFTWDVYLRDRTMGTTVLASLSPNTFAGTDSRSPSISADGRWVGFQSNDDLLVANDVNHTWDVFLYDRVTATVSLASQNDAGQQVNAQAGGPSVSSDGRLVLFATAASNLVTTPTSTGTQLYAHDMKNNEAPVVTLGADQALDEGVRLSRVASFSDQDASTSWTATVNYGDGAGSVALALNADKTFTLDHLFKPGSYVVTVAVTDDAAATGSGTFRVTVTNLAPTVNLGGAVDLTFDPTLRQSGTFSDPGTGTETYWATVDYGDGSGGRALTLTGSSFLLEHTYGTAGTYTVTVSVTDNEGASGSGTLAVTVRMYTFQWHEPVDTSFSVGRLLPVKFSVLRADGTPVFDSTVRVDVLDASGAVVAGYLYGASPSGSVAWNGNDYHVNVDTRGFAPGDYTLRVSFSSPTMTGSFTKQTTVTGAGVTGASNGKDKKDKAADKAAKAADKAAK
jgi:hypothetical protein